MKHKYLLVICLFFTFLSYLYASDKTSKVILKNGDIITGVILEQSIEKVTIKTEYITMTINTNDIKSIKYDIENMGRNNDNLFEDKNKDHTMITVKKYNKLPLLSLTAASGIFAYIQFDKSNKLSKEADAYKILGLTDLEKKSMQKSEDHTVYGILSSLISVVSFVISITPEYEEVPVKKYSYEINSNSNINYFSFTIVRNL